MVYPDLADLAGDIRALSTLLNVADYYWWPSASRTEAMVPTSFSYVSTLSSLATDLPVAVTGTRTADNVSITIVHPRRPDHRPQPELNQELEPVESHRVSPSTRNLMEIVENRPQDLEGYTGDLMDLFRIAHESTGTQTGTIMKWVICRGWSKLHAQIKRSETDFNDLFSLMEAWSPSDNDRISERVIKLPLPSSIYVKYADLTVDRTNDSEGAKFLLNKTTAPILIKTIARIFIDIRHTLADPNANRSTAAYSLVDSFIWLHVVLSNRYVKAIINETSLWLAILPKWPKRLSGHDDADRWEPLPGFGFQRDNDYVLRYLRTLVACATSVFQLSDPRVLPLFAAANATVVSLPALSHDSDAGSERCRIVQAVIAEIMMRDAPADAGWPQTASEWIGRLADTAALEEQKQDSASCRLHAEAGLMALACDARLSRGDEHASDKYGPALSSESNLARTAMSIGTSGKCCPLCFRLTHILNAHFADASQPGDPEALAFSHIPTHGKVLPWDPPQFGIPRAVLTQLRDDLWEKLVEEAIRVGKRDAPRPKADASSHSHDREPEEDMLAVQGRITLSEDISL